MGEEFNYVRPKRFPYGIVINEETAGLFIPEKSLVKAGWFGTPQIVKKDLSGGVEQGLFMMATKANELFEILRPDWSSVPFQAWVIGEV
jgi:hypothetical protein